jgi:hypothetical protein
LKADVPTAAETTFAGKIVNKDPSGAKTEQAGTKRADSLSKALGMDACTPYLRTETINYFFSGCVEAGAGFTQ